MRLQRNTSLPDTALATTIIVDYTAAGLYIRVLSLSAILSCWPVLLSIVSTYSMILMGALS